MWNKKNEGFTLVEALVASLILSLMLLSLIPGFIRAYDTSVLTALREEGTRIAYETMDELRNQGFSGITNSTSTVERPVKGALYSFSVNTTATSPESDLKTVSIRVGCTYKGTSYAWTVQSVIGDVDE